MIFSLLTNMNSILQHRPCNQLSLHVGHPCQVSMYHTLSARLEFVIYCRIPSTWRTSVPTAKVYNINIIP